jgi:ABC-type phosphonate transport system ATPase subunit
MSGPIIDITDLSKFYGKARGIEHVNLEIEEGEIFETILEARVITELWRKTYNTIRPHSSFWIPSTGA